MLTSGMAIDVGTVPNVQTALSPEGRKAAEQAAIELGQPQCVVNHVHGLQIFDDGGLPVRFLSIGAINLSPQTGYSMFTDALTVEVSRQSANYQTDAKLEVARDLFMAADVEQSGRSKFLILVTALEVLATRGKRSNELQTHIDSLIESTNEAKASAMHPDEMDALINDLGQQREQSIRSSIKQLARSAPGYSDEPDQTARTAADYYAARSKIVHDGVEPEGFDINAATSWVRNLVHALVLPERP